ncbi:MAG: hypothetical protein WC718_04695, partial [Phycisphaerales bacterium]
FTVAASPAGCTYRWQKFVGPGPNDFVNIYNGPTGNYGNYGGTALPTLSINGVYPADAILYRCVVTGPCGGVPAVSNPAQLTVVPLYARSCGGPGCDPDVNGDGNIDQGDIDYLINIAAGGDNPSGVDPDFNMDGNIDQGDVDALINVVAGGECP